MPKTTQLINTKTQRPIIAFEGERTLIYSKFLEHEMREMGIPIPHGLRGVYHGKENIRLQDPEFQQAFQEIYYLTTMDSTLFQWVEKE